MKITNIGFLGLVTVALAVSVLSENPEPRKAGMKAIIDTRAAVAALDPHPEGTQRLKELTDSTREHRRVFEDPELKALAGDRQQQMKRAVEKYSAPVPSQGIKIARTDLQQLSKHQDGIQVVRYRRNEQTLRSRVDLERAAQESQAAVDEIVKEVRELQLN